MIPSLLQNMNKCNCTKSLKNGHTLFPRDKETHLNEYRIFLHDKIDKDHGFGLGLAKKQTQCWWDSIQKIEQDLVCEHDNFFMSKDQISDLFYLCNDLKSNKKSIIDYLDNIWR